MLKTMCGSEVMFLPLSISSITETVVDKFNEFSGVVGCRTSDKRFDLGDYPNHGADVEIV